jgi:CRP/FNR family cyclic AMP-dependent transcriptional regulator
MMCQSKLTAGGDMAVLSRDKIGCIRNVSIFSGLSETDLEKLARISVLRRFPRNTTIFHEGDYAEALYVLQQGKVKIQITDEFGKEVILSVLQDGESFGEMALIDSQERCAEVVTMTACELIVISRDEFKRLLAESPDLPLALLRQFAHRMRQANRNIGNLATLDVLGRVARLLIESAVKENGSMVVRDLPTQKDMASMVGASREMVNRALKHLTSNGYLENCDGLLVIRDDIECALSAQCD